MFLLIFLLRMNIFKIQKRNEYGVKSANFLVKFNIVLIHLKSKFYKRRQLYLAPWTEIQGNNEIQNFVYKAMPLSQFGHT